MALDVKVGVAVCFPETAALVVDWLESCAVGDDYFVGCDAQDGAVEGVEVVDASAFVADVGVVPGPEGGKLADERAGNGGEGMEEGAVEEGCEEGEREGNEEEGGG